jgi:hypothetical protein
MPSLAVALLRRRPPRQQLVSALGGAPAWLQAARAPEQPLRGRQLGLLRAARCGQLPLARCGARGQLRGLGPSAAEQAEARSAAKSRRTRRERGERPRSSESPDRESRGERWSARGRARERGRLSRCRRVRAEHRKSAIRMSDKPRSTGHRQSRTSSARSLPSPRDPRSPDHEGSDHCDQSRLRHGSDRLHCAEPCGARQRLPPGRLVRA